MIIGGNVEKKNRHIKVGQILRVTMANSSPLDRCCSSSFLKSLSTIDQVRKKKKKELKKVLINYESFGIFQEG